jgi:hypothetical protein
MKLIEPMAELLNNDMYPISFLVVMELKKPSSQETGTTTSSATTGIPLHESLSPFLKQSVIIPADQPTKYELKTLASIISSSSNISSNKNTSSSSSTSLARKSLPSSSSDEMKYVENHHGAVIMILQNELGSRTWSPSDEVASSSSFLL